MSPSRTTTVSVDSRRIELQIDPDARLAAAPGGAARFLAEAAGLTSEEAAELQKSIVAACLETFEHLTGDHPHLTVTLVRYPDRIEVEHALTKAARSLQWDWTGLPDLRLKWEFRAGLAESTEFNTRRAAN